MGDGLFFREGPIPSQLGPDCVFLERNYSSLISSLILNSGETIK